MMILNSYCFTLIICFPLQREQMLQAQEMFRTSNKVTRPEKALILGFMAGSRGNLKYLTSATFQISRNLK